MKSNVQKWLIFILLIVLLLGTALNKLLVDWLWFQSEGFESVWFKILTTNIAVNLVIFLFIWLLLASNIFWARKNILNTIKEDYTYDNGMSLKNYLLSKILNGKRAKLILLFITFFLAASTTVSTNFKWEVVQKFLNRVDFGVTDPIFAQDIGFLVFTLPFFLKVVGAIINALLTAIIIAAILYSLTTPGLIINFRQFTKAHIHLAMLGATFFLFESLLRFLERYLLLYSPRGVAFGASYTDVYATLPGLNILIGITLLVCLLFVYAILAKNFKIVISGVLLVFVATIGLKIGYPTLIQKLQVEPNEFNKEQIFLKYNISYTLKAYGLDKVKTEEFPANNTLTAEELASYDKTLNNIRLWDWRPIGQTYNQLQSLRPYYIFPEVDVDRYRVEGKIRQVIIAARELDQSLLQPGAQTWVNQRLRYTHGFGAVVSPVNEVSPEGLPTFYLKNIPLSAQEPFLVERPEIYFGEKTDEYILVKTKTKEFDYPLGDNNAENYYAGDGGILIENILQRLNFALYFKDYKLLLTKDLTKDSQILFNRNITDRTKKIAPFLEFDQDPYLVISEKKLYWIQDAYTTTNMYPYAEPSGKWGNYIRNSVKVVTDAYNGDIAFYLVDQEDPIAKAYKNIFPELFKPVEEMPDGLRNHLRYPETMFKIQSAIFANYHMENPMVFYNKEDAWSIPEEIVAGETVQMDPYYVVMQLPNQLEEELMLMLPFNAAKINKMVAWMAARNDNNNYGELILYKFPKEKHIYGPLQVEARIDQDSEISQQLTLWDQRGSQVLRGNLLVIPIKDSILYIEPLYLQAENSKIPELRRVIAIYGERVVMGATFQEALEKLFKQIPSAKPLDGQVKTLPELVTEANAYYQEALEKQKAGDWAGYGMALDKLSEVLTKLKQFSQVKE